MKILIIGFQRSGTTLLRRLVNGHPKIKIFHEKKFIKKGKTRKAFFKNHPFLKDKKNFGDKIPWFDKDGKMIIRLSRKWGNFFGDEARVVHIIRHPVDVGLSTYKLNWVRRPEIPIEFHTKSVPRVVKVMNEDPRFINLRFEDLLISPEEKLWNLFEFCGLKVNDAIVKKAMSVPLRYHKGINSKRAYAHKKKKVNLKCKYPDYDELLKGAKLL